VPERQTVFPAGHGDKNSVLAPEHTFGLDGTRDLIVHELSKARPTKSGVVPGKADDGFRGAFGAAHDEAGSGQGWVLHDLILDPAPQPLSSTSFPSGNDRPNFHQVVILEHLILGHEIVAANHEMGFLNQAQIPEQFLDPLRSLDLDITFRLAKPDLHGRIIRR
jgi:hypothetical protein